MSYSSNIWRCSFTSRSSWFSKTPQFFYREPL